MEARGQAHEFQKPGHKDNARAVIRHLKSLTGKHPTVLGLVAKLEKLVAGPGLSRPERGGYFTDIAQSAQRPPIGPYIWLDSFFPEPWVLRGVYPLRILVLLIHTIG